MYVPNNMMMRLAFVFLVAVSMVAIAAESRYAWGQQDPSRPKEPLPASAVENMVVISKGAADKTAKHPIVPDPITVKSGSKITFVNNDNATHTAVQGSPEEGPTGFDSGVIAAGKNATVTVKGQPNQAIPYFCKIHPWLIGTIQIASNNSGGGGSGSATSNATGNGSQTTTFTIGGTIASWAAGSNITSNTVSPELLSGRWSLQVINGTAKSFDANITMVNANGSDFHTHRLSNFKVTQPSLPTTLTHNQTGSKVAPTLEITSANSSLSIPGRMDISIDGNKTWTNVSVSVMVNQLHSLYIATNEGTTGNHFTEGHFPPGIYGVVDSLKDKDGKELFQNGKVNLPAG
ncbi:MAG TPA: hypothetical protein VF016_02615 [Nitrososphaera sp.]|jgi:plastocyanin|nr:hypothetical protein [uncultured Nitrososphaera sp.]